MLASGQQMEALGKGRQHGVATQVRVAAAEPQKPGKQPQHTPGGRCQTPPQPSGWCCSDQKSKVASGGFTGAEPVAACHSKHSGGSVCRTAAPMGATLHREASAPCTCRPPDCHHVLGHGIGPQALRQPRPHGARIQHCLRGGERLAVLRGSGAAASGISSIPLW